MSYQHMDAIGDTAVIPKTLLPTFWHHQPKTDSNTSVDGSYQYGLHMLGQARNSAHNDRNDSECHNIHYNCMEHNKYLQEVKAYMEAYLCMDLVVLVLLVVCTVLITISNVFIIVLKDCILTRNVLQSINVMKRMRRSSWTPEPSSVIC